MLMALHGDAIVVADPTLWVDERRANAAVVTAAASVQARCADTVEGNRWRWRLGWRLGRCWRDINTGRELGRVDRRGFAAHCLVIQLLVHCAPCRWSAWRLRGWFARRPRSWFELLWRDYFILLGGNSLVGLNHLERTRRAMALRRISGPGEVGARHRDDKTDKCQVLHDRPFSGTRPIPHCGPEIDCSFEQEHFVTSLSNNT